MPERVGLTGLGLLGTALAERLLAAGFEVVGYDIVPERVEHLGTLGGEGAASPREVASRVGRVVLSLLNSEVVREVIDGPDGILEASPLPRLVVDTTTGDPDSTVEIGEGLSARGIGYLDATITGSSAQVRAGQAVLTVGGEEAHVRETEDILAAVTAKRFHVGPVGAGARTKLALNLILGLNRAALAEGLAFAEALGLDLTALVELLPATAAYSRIMDTKAPKMLRGDFAPEARLAQHRKDVALILEQARNAGQALPLSEAHLAMLDAAIAAGDGELDNSALIRELRRRRSG